MKKIKELWLPIFLIIHIFTITFLSYLFKKGIINLNIISKIYIGLLISNTLIILTMSLINIKNKKKLFNKKTDFFLLLIIIFSLISSLFAFDKNVAFFGFRGRYEGFFQIMYYFSLFLLSSFVKKEHKKYIVVSILICGALEAIYSILQVTQVFYVATRYNHGKPWATGFTNNPNFLGTLMLLCLCYSIGLFYDIKDKYYKIASCLLILLFTISLLLTNTLSVIVGLAVSIIYTIIYSVKNKNIKNLLIIGSIFIISFLLIIKLDHTSIIKDITKTKEQVVEISKGKTENDYGTKRIFIWKRIIWVLPNYIWHGVGIDNLYYAFDKKPLILNGKYFDKAHNEYLQILICEGIFALISYLLLFGSVLISGIKNGLKDKELYLILPVIGYLVQAFFNISVIGVAPFFYIALGLCYYRKSN